MDCPVNPLHYCHGDNVRNNQGHRPNEKYEDFGEKSEQFCPLLQPHFKVGYTGYTPGSTYNSTGLPYAIYTNQLLTDHRVAGSRLSRIPGDYHIAKSYQQTFPTDNPHKTIEPHFVPGYTGFTPGSGIRRSECFGDTYGRATHVKLAKHFLKGGRLRPILEYPAEYVAREEDDKFYRYEHELTRDDLKRKSRVLPGYAGHIPRAVFRHGKNMTEIAEESIAEFQKILNKNM